MNSARIKAYILLFIVAAIWGVASPVIKYTLEGFSPLVFLTYRFGISTVVAIVIFIFSGVHFPKDNKVRLLLIFYGFLTSTVALGFLFFGMEKTTVLDTALIALIDPLLISYAGVKFLNEHVTKREKIGILIAALGTLVVIIGPLIGNTSEALKLSGNLLIFSYVVITAICAVLTKKLLQLEVKPITMTNFSFIVGFVTLLPVAIYKIGFTQLINGVTLTSGSYHLGVVYMALFSGTVAYFLANKAQKTIEIGETAVFNYLNPLFSVPLAVIWLKEEITPIFIVGAIVIALGVFIAEVKKKRYNNAL